MRSRQRTRSGDRKFEQRVRNGRMLTTLANRRRRVLCDAAAIIRFGDGTGTAACQRMRQRPRRSDRQRVPPWRPDRLLSFPSEGPYRSSRPDTDQRVFPHKLAIGHLAASKRHHQGMLPVAGCSRRNSAKLSLATILNALALTRRFQLPQDGHDDAPANRTIALIVSTPIWACPFGAACFACDQRQHQPAVHLFPRTADLVFASF